MAIVFGDGVEPHSVARGGVKRWLHCRIDDVSELPDTQRDELAAWLAAHGNEPGTSLLVTRDEGGTHYVNTVAVDVAELPSWLQGPEPQPKPVKATKARK